MGDPCDRCEELLQDFLDRTLTDAEWREAETHLSGCDYCARRYKFEESLRRYVRTSSVERMPPPTVNGRNTRAAVRDTTSRIVSRFSWLAVISRKVSSSAPAAS